MSPGNSFILGVKGQGHESQKHWRHRSLHSCGCWLRLVCRAFINDHILRFSRFQTGWGRVCQRRAGRMHAVLQCSKTCGFGRAHRELYCVDHGGHRHPAHNCHVLAKPETHRHCYVGPCQSAVNHLSSVNLHGNARDRSTAEFAEIPQNGTRCFAVPVGMELRRECNNVKKQGVALTGRDTTGPPRAAPWWVTLHMRVLQTTTDASDRY